MLSFSELSLATIPYQLFRHVCNSHDPWHSEVENFLNANTLGIYSTGHIARIKVNISPILLTSMNVREKLNWKDTNLALFGSDLEKKIKAAAADSEPQWSNIGTSVALHIWRIEQFMVKPWPSNKHGKV
jgi:hypothetical protein